MRKKILVQPETESGYILITCLQIFQNLSAPLCQKINPYLLYISIMKRKHKI